MADQDNNGQLQDQGELGGSGFLDASEVNKPSFSGNIPDPVPKQGETQIPRRLSKIFLPPCQEELSTVEDEINETSCLLGDHLEGKPLVILPKVTAGALSGVIIPKGGLNPLEKIPGSEEELDKLSILDKITDGKEESDFTSSGNASDPKLASPTSSSDEDEEVKNKQSEYTSWDDTICSNRSAYFKHYYQLNSSRVCTGVSPHTSLHSLIKDKNAPTMAPKENSDNKNKNKKDDDTGLMFLVIFLFLVLVVGISLIHHFYKLHLTEMSFFIKVKFFEEGRILNLYDSDGDMDISVKLGTTLSPFAKPEDCTFYLHYLQTLDDEYEIVNEDEFLDDYNQTQTKFVFKSKWRPTEFQFDEETVCLDWVNQARVQIHKSEKSNHSVNCYNVYWSSHDPTLPLKDCILMDSHEDGTWWGLGELTGGGFPLVKIGDLHSSSYMSGKLGKSPWGGIVRRAFLSSKGGLVMLPNHIPVGISVKQDRLCIAVNSTTESMESLPLTLNYTICASQHISSTLRYLGDLSAAFNNMSKKELENSVSSNRAMVWERIQNPVWVPYLQPEQPKLTQASIIEYANKVLLNNANNSGYILLPPSWQKKMGEFTFDPMRFPNPRNLTDTLKSKGFRLSLTISPLISTDTKVFKNGTKEGLWVQQKGSSLPVLVQYNSMSPAAIVDFTNPRAVEWFVSKLQSLKDAYTLDSYYITPVDSFSIPRYHEFHEHIPNPDQGLQPFLKAVRSVSPPISTEGSLMPPAPPTFVTVGNEESGWQTLASLIPRILTLTLLGYSLIDAGIIGGIPVRPGNIPEDELYIRWYQTACFLPAFQINAIPDLFEDYTRAIVSEYSKKRRTLVLPRFEMALNDTLLYNATLISPLALQYPDDPVAASIADEWIVGEDLLVAPVLHKGKTTRDIYIPDGLWESVVDGRLKRGPGWTYDYKVPLTNLAHFIKRHYSSLRQ